MAFPNHLLNPSTWRIVGLGLTTSMFALGALSIVSPSTAASSLGVIPTTPEGHEVAAKGMVFLGIRDLAAATALSWYALEGKQKEMGVLTLAWTLVCVVDTWVATKGPIGWDGGIWTLCAGAVMAAFVGLGLVQS